MRPYEVMIILDPGTEDEAIRAEVDRCTELIRSRGGNPGRIDRWGKRRLAYEIQKHREGYYVLMEATAEPSVMAELDRSLQLSDRVMRHKVLRMPDRPARRPGVRTAPPEPEPALSVPSPSAAEADAAPIAADPAAETAQAQSSESGTS